MREGLHWILEGISSQRGSNRIGQPGEVVFKERLDMALKGLADKVVIVHRLDLIPRRIFPT